MQTSQTDAGRADHTIVYGAFALDPSGWSVTVGGNVVPLTASEFILLRELVLHPGRVLARDALERALTNAPTPIRRQSCSSAGRGVDLLISRVRRKLQQAGYDGIRTMRFVGYRFEPVARG